MPAPRVNSSQCRSEQVYRSIPRAHARSTVLRPPPSPGPKGSRTNAAVGPKPEVGDDEPPDLFDLPAPDKRLSPVPAQVELRLAATFQKANVAEKPPVLHLSELHCETSLPYRQGPQLGNWRHRTNTELAPLPAGATDCHRSIGQSSRSAGKIRPKSDQSGRIRTPLRTAILVATVEKKTGCDFSQPVRKWRRRELNPGLGVLQCRLLRV